MHVFQVPLLMHIVELGIVALLLPGVAGLFVRVTGLLRADTDDSGKRQPAGEETEPSESPEPAAKRIEKSW